MKTAPTSPRTWRPAALALVPWLLITIPVASCGPVAAFRPEDAQALERLLGSEALVEGSLVLEAGTHPKTDLPPVLPPTLSRIFAAWAEVPPASCVRAEGGKDVDGDGVPVGYSAWFTCLDQKADGGGGHFSVAGGISVDDTDDERAGAGATIRLRGLVARQVLSDGTVLTRSVDGTFVLRPSGDGVRVERDATFGVRVEAPGAAASEASLTSRATVLLEDGADPAIARSEGDLVLRLDGREIPLSRRVEGPPTWSAACARTAATASGYIGGTWWLEDAAGTAIRYEFTGCGHAALRTE